MFSFPAVFRGNIKGQQKETQTSTNPNPTAKPNPTPTQPLQQTPLQTTNTKPSHSSEAFHVPPKPSVHSQRKLTHRCHFELCSDPFLLPGVKGNRKLMGNPREQSLTILSLNNASLSEEDPWRGSAYVCVPKTNPKGNTPN